jgi:hypothetical protein
MEEDQKSESIESTSFHRLLLSLMCALKPSLSTLRVPKLLLGPCASRGIIDAIIKDCQQNKTKALAWILAMSTV